MNNFNTVFLAVKRRCQKQQKIAEISCFEDIASDAKVPLAKLPLYLNHLQEIGLIKFSIADKYIYLTAFGNKQEKLVAESP